MRRYILVLSSNMSLTRGSFSFLLYSRADCTRPVTCDWDATQARKTTAFLIKATVLLLGRDDLFHTWAGAKTSVLVCASIWLRIPGSGSHSRLLPSAFVVAFLVSVFYSQGMNKIVMRMAGARRSSALSFLLRTPSRIIESERFLHRSTRSLRHGYSPVKVKQRAAFAKRVVSNKREDIDLPCSRTSAQSRLRTSRSHTQARVTLHEIPSLATTTR